MNRTLVQAASPAWRFRAHSLAAATRRLSTVPAQPAPYDLVSFREAAFIPEKPLVFKNDGTDKSLPAASTWFSPDPSSGNGAMTLSSYLMQYSDEASFPYELYSPPPAATGDQKQTPPVVAFCEWLSRSPDFQDQMLAGILHATAGDSFSGAEGFFQLQAPLKLLARALAFNSGRVSELPLLLYVAQSSVDDLPAALRDDLPTPDLVRRAGRGDVYASSIWLGTEPTYTPLHRDPNPNLFCQLCSRKTVRLLPPRLGERVFFEVQARLRQQNGGGSRVRGSEMMEGAERALLSEAVWAADDKLPDELQQAHLDPGDSLFVPKGWWHSVKSVGGMGGLNGSVNWWFR